MHSVVSWQYTVPPSLNRFGRQKLLLDIAKASAGILMNFHHNWQKYIENALYNTLRKISKMHCTEEFFDLWSKFIVTTHQTV